MIKIDSTTDSDADVKAALGNQQRIEDKPQTQTTTEVAVEPKVEAVASETTEGDAGKKPVEPAKVEEKPGNLDKRFAKLTKQRKELEARVADEAKQRAYWENEAKRYRDSAQPKPVETKVEEVKPVEAKSGAPKQEDFATYQEYVEAKMDWKFKVAEEERELKQSLKATKEAMDSKWKTYSDKEKAFMKEKPDFQERIDAMRDAGVKMSPIVESRIIESASPELAYELMKDADEFKALCGMSPNDALEHIGIVKAQLKAQSQPKADDGKVVEIVKQPKPVAPVGSKVTVIKDPEKMSVREYDAWRRAGNSPTG